ncbi:hypothetical protein GC105_14640 [Alkalibaculum sp. M08DMB]|uniref:Uncharacterized protein n=1 Tax=Alkalibaculum sporogenes TaxID=2655001 RepID=A0A6A7KBU0_9FIRM|nr:hypothetical protein [Alkalibaculum sporogenes]MPW27019.1 hypothetical protein [Alkalibaculum sporogenes]
MNKDQIKSIIEEKITNANYTTRGTATVGLEEISDLNVIESILEELSSENEYSRYSIELDKGTKTLNVIDPDENLEGFENIHPSRKPCN